MGEIIQYEGVAYKKVNRKAQAGDVVMARVCIGSSMDADRLYLVSAENNIPQVWADTHYVALYADSHGRTEATVDVYERVEGRNIEPKVQLGTIPCDKVSTAPESEQDRQIRYLNHPFYKDAREYWQDVQDTQIYKGAEKYGEPFTPSTWTIRQLLEHAMQENVDQAHYIYGMYQKVQEMEQELKELREFRDQVQKTVVKWGAMNEPKSGDA